MGAWGYQVMSNDYNCDTLTSFLTEDPVHRLVDSLFAQRDDEHALLLGVAIVDASINGVDEKLLGGFGDYPNEGKEFFYSLAQNPLTGYISSARSAIDRLIYTGVDDWSEDVQYERMNLYLTYQNRLG